MLIRERQFGLKVEGTEGTEESLSAADFACNPSKTGFTYHANEYERGIDIGTQTKLPNLRGPRYGTIKTTLELAGGSASASPKWHDAIQAAGFAKAQLKVVSLTGAPSGGSFKIGQKIGDNATEGSATKTGTFVKYVAGSPNKIVYLPGTGTFADGDTIYNYALVQVSATQAGAASNAGFRLTPKSERDGVVPPSASGQVRENGQRHTVIGSRGGASLTIEHGKPVLMDLTLEGPCVLDSGTPTAVSAMTGIPALPVPGVAGEGGVGVGVPFTFDAYGPIATQFKIDLGNTLTPRATLGTSLAGSGYLAERITDRKVSFSTDPEHPAAGTYDFIAKLLAGTAAEFYTEIGKSSGASGLIIIHGPAIQYTGDFQEGDRNGIATANLNGMFTGTPTGDDEISIDHVFV